MGKEEKVVLSKEQQKLNKKKLGKRLGSISYKTLRAVILLGICYYILYPLLAKVMMTLMERQDLYDLTVGLIPRHFTFDNIKLVFKFLDYPKSFLITLLLSVGVTIAQLISCTLVGYGFARFKFPLKGVIFALVIFTLVVPPATIIIPQYLNFTFFNPFGIYKLITGGSTITLVGTPWTFILSSLTCMGFKNALYIYLIRQYYRGVPKELEEAALIDGSGYFKTFYSVMLPSAKPILTVVAMFSVVWQWTDIFYTTWYMKGSNVLARMLDSLAASISSNGGTTTMVGMDTKYIMLVNSAGGLLVVLPLIIFYIFAQKQFVEGIERSGIVG